MTVPLLESKSIAEVSAPGQSIKFKNSALMCQKSHFPLPMPTLPQSGTVQGQERPPWPMVFPTRESTSEVSIQLPQACRALTAQDAHFYLIPPRILRGWAQLTHLGKTRSREKGWGLRATSMHISTTTHRSY